MVRKLRTKIRSRISTLISACSNRLKHFLTHRHTLTPALSLSSPKIHHHPPFYSIRYRSLPKSHPNPTTFLANLSFKRNPLRYGETNGNSVFQQPSGVVSSRANQASLPRKPLEVPEITRSNARPIRVANDSISHPCLGRSVQLFVFPIFGGPR